MKQNKKYWIRCSSIPAVCDFKFPQCLEIFKIAEKIWRLLRHFLRYFFFLLKELRNCNLRINLCVVIILFNTGLYKSAFATYLFGKLVVLSFCAFCAYFFCREFDVIFLHFYNIYIIIVYVLGVRCFCSQLLEVVC